jgi:hypothetical protein
MDSGTPTGAPTPAADASMEPADESISLAELEAQITELAGHLNAANYRWLTLIGEFDRRNGWADGKLPSCAHWLNFKCGLNLGAARERVRVAHALVGLPKIAASMARGELSYSKVRALTRVACQATEESFLMIALHGTAHHVERLVKGYRRAQDAAELSREAREEECTLSFEHRRADAEPSTHPHRARHSHRPRHRRHPLAGRAHGLRSRSLGAVPAGRQCPWL